MEKLAPIHPGEVLLEDFINALDGIRPLQSA
jgi:plasmid maintenance system antidote protein VapI